jgi:hypothetical protein
MNPSALRERSRETSLALAPPILLQAWAVVAATRFATRGDLTG